MGTKKKAIERRRAEVKAAGGLQGWFARSRTQRRLDAAFRPSKRPARVIPQDEQ